MAPGLDPPNMTDASTRTRRTAATPTTLRVAHVVTLLCALVALAAAGQALAARDLTASLDVTPPVVDNSTFTVNMSAFNSGSGAGSSVEIQLYLDGNATAPPHNVGNLANGEYGNASEDFTLPCGVYQFNATVDPSDGVPETNESNNNASLSVVVLPYMNFTSNLSGSVGAYSLALNASASHGCAPLNFTWMISGDTFYGPVVDYLPLAGNLTVSLTVRSDANQSFASTMAQNFSIPNAPPTLTLDPPSLSIQTLQHTLISVNAQDADGELISFFIDFGDGNNTTNLADVAAYEYHQSGNFTLNVFVVDNLGAHATASASVQVSNRPPVAVTEFSYWVADTGATVHFNASSSSDPERGPLSFAWDFGDGTKGTGAMPNHSYSAPGAFKVNVTVTDNLGATSNAEITVQVFGAPVSGGFPWIWIVILVLLTALVLFMLMRGRKEPEETADKPTSTAPPKTARRADDKTGEGSSGKPPSP
jgi:PKD repeat protein